MSTQGHNVLYNLYYLMINTLFPLAIRNNILQVNSFNKPGGRFYIHLIVLS